jgi:hypothetical protein
MNHPDESLVDYVVVLAIVLAAGFAVLYGLVRFVHWAWAG